MFSPQAHSSHLCSFKLVPTDALLFLFQRKNVCLNWGSSVKAIPGACLKMSLQSVCPMPCEFPCLHLCATKVKASQRESWFGSISESNNVSSQWLPQVKWFCTTWENKWTSMQCTDKSAWHLNTEDADKTIFPNLRKILKVLLLQQRKHLTSSVKDQSNLCHTQHLAAQKRKTPPKASRNPQFIFVVKTQALCDLISRRVSGFRPFRILQNRQTAELSASYDCHADCLR